MTAFERMDRAVDGKQWMKSKKKHEWKIYQL